MKKLFALLILSVSFSVVNGQRSIDALFRKYSEKDGFTVLTVSGNILKTLYLNCRDREENCKPSNIDEIRILIEEDKSDKEINFYNALMEDINMSEYEEYMTINGSEQNIVILVRTAGNIIKEFLLVGGGEDNVVVQIKGEIPVAEAEKLVSDMKRNRAGRLSVITN